MTRFRRREFLQAATGGVLLGNGRFAQMLLAQEAPAAIKRDGARPAAGQAAACGDVGPDRAIIWSRSDRPAPDDGRVGDE